MVPVLQTKFIEKDGYGDCTRAAVASVLELNLSDVPEFEKTEPKEDMMEKMVEFIKSFGYSLVGTHVFSEVENHNHIDPVNETFNGYYLVAGTSPRSEDKMHMVVYKAGRLAHDPHPSGLGLTSEKWAVLFEKDFDGSRFVTLPDGTRLNQAELEDTLTSAIKAPFRAFHDPDGLMDISVKNAVKVLFGEYYAET